MRKQKELVLIRLVWLPIFLFIAGSASKTFFQWTISPRVIYLFVCLFTFFFTNCVFPPLLEMLSISSRGRRVQALRGEPASPGYGAERGLALSAGSWAGAGAAPAAGTVQQHPGERPGRGSTADSARPFRATDCSLAGAPSRAAQGFGLMLLRPRPQYSLDWGLGALHQFSLRKKETSGPAYLFTVSADWFSLNGEIVALFSEEKLVRGTIHEYGVQQGW